MNAKSVVSEVRHVLQRHLTDLALQPIPITHVPQVLPLEVLRQVSRLSKGLDKLLAQAQETYGWPLLLEHRQRRGIQRSLLGLGGCHLRIDLLDRAGTLRLG